MRGQPEKKPSSSACVLAANVTSAIVVPNNFVYCMIPERSWSWCYFCFTCLKGENSSRSFLWGLLLSQAAELTSVFAIACMIILFQTEAIWAYLCSTAWENRGIAGHMHLRPGLNTVGCLTSPHVGCLVSHFLGRELEKHKEYIYQHALCVLKLRLYYCQKDC